MFKKILGLIYVTWFALMNSKRMYKFANMSVLFENELTQEEITSMYMTSMAEEKSDVTKADILIATVQSN